MDRAISYSEEKGEIRVISASWLVYPTNYHVKITSRKKKVVWHVTHMKEETFWSESW